MAADGVNGLGDDPAVVPLDLDAQTKTDPTGLDLLGELGMSPASRSNVDVPPPAVEGSAFQKFLERGRRLDERRQQREEPTSSLAW